MYKVWHAASYDTLEFVQTANITQALPEHFHEMYSIGLAMQGVQRLVIGDEKLLVSPGTILLASPYQTLAHAPLTGVEWAHQMLHISPDFMRYLQRQGYLPRQHPLTFAEPLHYNSAWATRYTALHQGPDVPTEQGLGKLLGELFAASPASVEATTPHRSVIEAVQTYLQSVRDQKLSLEDVARRFTMDKYQLIRYFKRQVGVTPNDYLTILRVEQAKGLLAQGLPLVEVALETGFYDQSHFARYFRSYTGLTPGNYQRNCTVIHD